MNFGDNVHDHLEYARGRVKDLERDVELGDARYAQATDTIRELEARCQRYREALEVIASFPATKPVAINLCGIAKEALNEPKN